MKERVKPFWFVVVTVLVSVTLLLTVSCGGDDDDDSNSAESGTSGSAESGTSGSAESGTSGGSSGSGSMKDAGIDGAIFKPTSNGDVAAEGACTTPIGTFISETVSGICKPGETKCPGGFGPSSDCAEGLVCCIDTNQCEAASESVASSNVMMGLVQGLECVPEGSCEGVNVMIATIPMEVGGCPQGETCCPIVPAGGLGGLIEAGGGLGGLLEGGLGGLLEGGTSSDQDAGASSSDAGTSSNGDAATTTDSGAQQ